MPARNSHDAPSTSSLSIHVQKRPLDVAHFQAGFCTRIRMPGIRLSPQGLNRKIQFRPETIGKAAVLKAVKKQSRPAALAVIGVALLLAGYCSRCGSIIIGAQSGLERHTFRR